jgi:hypothetical protein
MRCDCFCCAWTLVGFDITDCLSRMSSVLCDVTWQQKPFTLCYLKYWLAGNKQTRNSPLSVKPVPATGHHLQPDESIPVSHSLFIHVCPNNIPLFTYVSPKRSLPVTYVQQTWHFSSAACLWLISWYLVNTRCTCYECPYYAVTVKHFVTSCALAQHHPSICFRQCDREFAHPYKTAGKVLISQSFT